MLPEVCQIWCLSTWPLGILVPVPQRQGTRGEFIIKELFALGRRQGKTLFFKARHRNRIELACIPWLPCNSAPCRSRAPSTDTANGAGTPTSVP